jgi:hypothetical protein
MKITKFKRFLTIAICAASLVLMPFSPVFAADSIPDPSKDPLEITSCDPDDGDNHMPAQNAGFKLYFDGNVTDDSVKSINSKAFVMTDAEGAEIPVEVFFSSKNDNYILVTAKPESGSLVPKSEYKLTIAESLADANGRTLREKQIISVSTVDTTGNTRIYMLLMVLMVVAMVVMTIVSNKRKARAEADSSKKEKVVNPYKLAKEKGISVDEAMAIIEKDRKRRAKRLAAEAGTPKAAEEKSDGRHHLKSPRPISAGGSSYVTGRKALAEKKAREEAARRAKGTTNPKGKGKGKSKK